jgi:hypothetical protein
MVLAGKVIVSVLVLVTCLVDVILSPYVTTRGHNNSTVTVIGSRERTVGVDMDQGGKPEV